MISMCSLEEGRLPIADPTPSSLVKQAAEVPHAAFALSMLVCRHPALPADLRPHACFVPCLAMQAAEVPHAPLRPFTSCMLMCRHRAVLFKVVADLLPHVCSVPCSLVRRPDDIPSDWCQGSGYNAWVCITCAPCFQTRS